MVPLPLPLPPPHLLLGLLRLHFAFPALRLEREKWERPARGCRVGTVESATAKEGEGMAGIGPIRQDWEPVVVRKKAPTAAAKKDEKAVNAARRAGAEIETMRKCKWFF